MNETIHSPPTTRADTPFSTGGDDGDHGGDAGEISIKQLDQAAWQCIASRFADHNYRQSWHYGIAAARRRRAESEHVAVCRGDEVIALADVRIKRVPVLGGGLAYISGGPLVRRGETSDPELLDMALRALRDEYVQRRQLILHVAAPLGTDSRPFERAGLSKTERGKTYRTLLVDLSRPADAIRKSLAQKWRNGLNGAERNGLEIRCGSSTELLAEFCELFNRFRDRKHFDLDIDPSFYLELQREDERCDRLVVSLCHHDGQLIAGHVASLLGDTSVYLFGATDDLGLKKKASYLLQWHAIQYAKAHGMRWYDLGGIDPDENPNVFHFKSGMGGIDMTAPGPFEIRPDGMRASLLLRGECALRGFGRGRFRRMIATGVTRMARAAGRTSS
jgi:lipid II:glycine glycyltransferase (peptidoglycan interpeptide bridge formation enzyme)